MRIAEPALLAPRYRVAAAVLVIGCAAVVTVLGIRYAHQTRPGAFDRGVDDWFLDHVNYRTALWFADLGNGLVVVVCTLAVVVFFAWLRYPRGIVLAVLAPIASSSLTEYLLKPLVHRTKAGYLAYPSGHTTGWCTVVLVVVLVTAGAGQTRLGTRARRWIVGVAAVLGVACMLGLIGSDYHYATDVIGGLAVATGTTLVLALLVDELAPRIRPASGSPTGPGTTAGTASSAGTRHRPIRPSRPSRR